MSTSTSNPREPVVAPAVQGLGSDIRIDAPHRLGVVSETVPPEVEPLLDESSDLLDQLRKQAHQLAQHLLTRQRETDARESRLNAMQASLENESRTERLWLLEQRASLAEQAEDLVRRECELQERASRVSAAEEHLDQLQHQLDASVREQTQHAEQRVSQLDAAATRLAAHAAALKAAQRRWRAEQGKQRRALKLARQALAAQRAESESKHHSLLQSIEAHRARLARQENEISARESALVAYAAQLDTRRQVLDCSEERLERDWDACRQQQLHLTEAAREQQARQEAAARHAEAERRQWQARLENQQHLLARRSEELDARRAELLGLQERLRQLHKESLEARLVSEELLGQLSSAVPEASLTNSISRLRRRLDDQFRLAQSDLAQQRQELETLRATLTERFEQLMQQKAHIQTWVHEREATIEQQAARLVAREQELDSQQEQFAALNGRWEAERQGYQQEIRRLLGQLRREERLA